MMKIENIPVESVKVRRRLRRQLGDISQLKHSLQEVGLLQPIIINKHNQLIAGGRRLEAAKKLGWKMIPAYRFEDEISTLVETRLEIEENLLRKNFSEEELHLVYQRLSFINRTPWYLKIYLFFVDLLRKIKHFFGGSP